MNGYLTITETAKLYPRGTHRNTVVRHIRKGVRTSCGVVKLEATRRGGRWTVARQAVDDFFAKLTAASGVKPTRASDAREASRKAAVAYLASRGIG
jgi:hypothetical protein